MKRVVLTTGGTGGHIFPALSVAQALAKRHPGLEALFVGGAGPEGDLARKAGLRFVGLPAAGVFGRGLKSLVAPIWVGRAMVRAVALLREFAPEAVVGFGGYAGFCPVVAAALLRLPTAVHEQNSVPGVTNRVLSRLVDRVLVSYPDEQGRFPARKTVLTGNPVRADIAAMAGGPAPEAGMRVLVLGGSQGARAVNEAVMAALPELLDAGVAVTLQTGRNDFERASLAVAEVMEARREAGTQSPTVILENFIEDMAGAYAGADLVIARAGATTLAEITAAGRPSILIPFPFATHDHQTVNASFLSRAGAAVVLAQRDLTPASLSWTALSILRDARKRAAMARAAASLAAPNAAVAIAEELENLAESGKRKGAAR